MQVAIGRDQRVTFGSRTRRAASVAITGRLLEGASALAVCDHFSTGFGQAGRDGIDHRNTRRSERAESSTGTFDEEHALLAVAREQHPWGRGTLGPVLLRHDGARTVLRSPAVEQMGMALIELPTSTRTHDELISRVRVHGQPPQHWRTPGEESTVG